MEAVQSILKNHHLRLTQSREEILAMFLAQPTALSEREIESSVDVSCDRVTIYRTLATFLEKGILHKVLDDTGAMKYALCSPECHGGEEHRHDHVHFKCVQCGQTLCLDQVPIPTVQLPQGYHLQEVNMLLEGVCESCNG